MARKPKTVEVPLAERVRKAWNDAYYEQERRTVDGDVKRAVREALTQMMHAVLEEPYTPPPVTLKDVTRMEAAIEPKAQVLTEWARLLRYLYCNPSDDRARLTLNQFEHKHRRVLDPLMRKFQQEPLPTREDFL